MMMMATRKRVEEIVSIEELSSVQKVACLLISLGPGTAAELMRHFNDETEVERSAAMKGIMRWVRLHPYNISQKVQIVVEHFRENVQSLLRQGNANRFLWR